MSKKKIYVCVWISLFLNNLTFSMDDQSTLLDFEKNQINTQKMSKKLFIDEKIKSKKFETFYDLVKDKDYKDQRQSYLHGNCLEHPMDTLIKKMQNSGISVQKFVKEGLKVQEAAAFAETEKRLGEQFRRKLAEKKKTIDQDLHVYKEASKKLPQVITYDPIAEKKISPKLKAQLQQLQKKNNIEGTVHLMVLDSAADGIAAREDIGTGKKYIVIGAECLEDENILFSNLQHEFKHLKYNDSARHQIITHHTDFELHRTANRRFSEWRADLEPSSESFENAQLREASLQKEVGNENKWWMFDFPEWASTHPRTEKRLKDAKVIKRMHETIDNLAKRKIRVRYDEEKFERYVIGYEKAWDKWCEAQDKKPKFRIANITEFLKFMSPWN